MFLSRCYLWIAQLYYTRCIFLEAYCVFSSNRREPRATLVPLLLRSSRGVASTAYRKPSVSVVDQAAGGGERREGESSPLFFRNTENWEGAKS